MDNEKKSVDKLIAENQGFVVSIASHYKKRGLDMDDLVSEGNIGMLQAARKYDPKQGRKFISFAAPYIRDAIEKAIEQQSGLYRVPRDVEDVSWEKKRSRALSIDAPIGGSTELSLGRVIPDKSAPDPEKQLQTEIERKDIEEALSRLESREQHVLQRFYGIGVEAISMAEIAREMGLKRERVRQIRNHALRKVRREHKK